MNKENKLTKLKYLLDTLSKYCDSNIVKSEEDIVEEFIDINFNHSFENFRVKKGGKNYKKGAYYFYIPESDDYILKIKPSMSIINEYNNVFNLYIFEL